MLIFDKFDFEKFQENVFVTDEKLFSVYHGFPQKTLVLPCGEEAKSFACIEKVCKFFLQNELCRGEKVIAVGGGALLDAVGFACSIYKRGLKVLLVPTTLLAMVDSAIGGKTAINLDGVKNAVGSFISADTFVDVDFLDTLSASQIDDGMGEVYKYCFLNRKIAKLVGNANVKELVKPCALFKQKIVKRDYFDNGLRRILNLGHTVGHALELQYGLGHGTAVLYGLNAELQISRKLGYASANYGSFLPKPKAGGVEINGQTLENACNDKKNKRGKICFVLPKDNYQTATVYLDKAELTDLMKK